MFDLSYDSTQYKSARVFNEIFFLRLSPWSREAWSNLWPVLSPLVNPVCRDTNCGLVIRVVVCCFEIEKCTTASCVFPVNSEILHPVDVGKFSNHVNILLCDCFL